MESLPDTKGLDTQLTGTAASSSQVREIGLAVNDIDKGKKKKKKKLSLWDPEYKLSE